jgi:HK97 family phage major capsid protein
VRTIEDVQDDLDVIAQLAEAESRDLTDDEIAQVEAFEAELTAAQARREKTEAALARIKAGRERATPALHVKTGGQVEDTIEAAFTAYLRTGRENADIQELRNAQSEGIPTEGGFLVPPGFREKIVERMVAFGGLASVVDEIVTDTGNSLPWPTLDDTANTGEIVAEGGTFSGGADLVFGEATLGAYSYMAGGAGGAPLRISRELVQDSAFDIVGRVTAALGTRMARIQAQHIVRGTGVSQPQGIVKGLTGAGMYSGGSDALVYADFLNAIHAVDPAYRDGGNCRWAFNDTFLEAVEGVLDLNGRPILKDATAGADSRPSGGTILGYPVTIDQGFTSPTATSATINFGVFGDLREGYVIRRVKAIELLVNPYSRMAIRQIEFSCWSRMDAVQQNTNAYTALTGTA